MNKIIFKGTCTAAITPFTADGINYDALGKQIEYQIENGIDAITILGTTGEAPTISDSEYESIAKFSFDKIAGRVKFILGSGSNCTKKAIEKSQLAQNIGADGLLVVTPYYNKCTQKGLVKYYNDVCDNVDIPVLCYNVPARTGVNILPQTMADAASSGSSFLRFLIIRMITTAIIATITSTAMRTQSQDQSASSTTAGASPISTIENMEK